MKRKKFFIGLLIFFAIMVVLNTIYFAVFFHELGMLSKGIGIIQTSFHVFSIMIMLMNLFLFITTAFYLIMRFLLKLAA